MKFAFIDGSKSDKSTRRLARSHAMKGKNVGKTRPRRSIEVRHYGEHESITNPAQGTMDLYHTALGRNALLSAAFPIEVAPQSQDAVNQFFTIVVEALYPPRLCKSTDRVKSQWLRVMFADRTSYHCTLSLMATMNDFFFEREVESAKAIGHLNQAIRLVNQSLQTAEALSASNVSVVNFLVVHGLVREEKLKAEVHLKGLQKIIELRGGFSQLDSLLAIKICKTDLDFALHYGTSTCFYRDRMPEVTSALASEGFKMNPAPGFRTSRLHPFLQQILLDVLGIASLFNSDQNGFRIDPCMFQEFLVSVGCRLVRFHRLAEPPLQMRSESAYHIGLEAFVATLFLQFGRRRFLKYRLISQCIKSAIERGLDEEDKDLMLWLLFIGGVSVLGGPDRAWLSPKIYQVAQSLDITCWAGAQQCLVQFPWILSLYDEAGKELWDLAMAHGAI